MSGNSYLNIASIAASFALALMVCPSAASASSLKMDRIFSSAIKAVGGEKEIAKIETLEASADCTGPKGKYTTGIVSHREGKTIFRQNFSYRDPSNILINGDLAFSGPDKTGKYLTPSGVERLFVRLHEFQLMSFDFRKMFRDFSVEGRELFEGRPSIKVRALTALGGPVFLFFDKKTKLLSGYIFPIPDSSQSVKNVFSEWKKVGKLKLPTVVTATDSSGTWVLHFHTITVNKTDMKAFDIPAAAPNAH